MGSTEFLDFKKQIQFVLCTIHKGYSNLSDFRRDFIEDNDFDPEMKAREFGYQGILELLESEEIEEFIKIEVDVTNYGEFIYKGREIDGCSSILDAMRISEEEKEKKWDGRGQNYGKQRAQQDGMKFSTNSNNWPSRNDLERPTTSSASALAAVKQEYEESNDKIEIGYSDAETIRIGNDDAKEEPCLPCTEIVEKVLECGHKTLDEFWKPIDMIACRTTIKKCSHPYAGEKCLEKCTKFCRNGLHQNCQLLCYEYCLPCTEIIEKKLKCGHTTTGACWKPVELVPCKMKCSSILPCNHKCAGRCSAKCPPCLVPVLKELSCGHQKMMECSKSVTAAIKCRILVEKQWPICGHIVEVECHVNPEKVPCPKPCVKTLNEDGENNNDQCHHPCKGTCGQCRNGRLHIECNEECKRILICDHECGSKCSRGCPPCQQPCETRCGHGQCCFRKDVGRRCGEQCPPCQKPCLNECPHRKCSKQCSEPCNVLSCNQPCARRLKCSPLGKWLAGRNFPEHFCAGMCSEKCIEICRICEPKKFQEEVAELFFGDEDEPDAHFVQLEDCHHYFEVKALDKWVMQQMGKENGGNNQQQDRKIIKISCPKCKTPIRRSKRYISLLNQQAKDIEQIKLKIIGKSVENLQNEWALKKETVLTMKQWKGQLQIGHLTYHIFSGKVEKIANLLNNFQKVNLTFHWIESTMKNIESISKIMKSGMEKVVTECPTSVEQWTKTLDGFKIDPNDVQIFLLNDLAKLLDRISECPGGIHTISNATFNGLVSELRRNEFMLELFKFMKKVPPPSAASQSSELEQSVLEILQQIHADKPFTEIRAKMNDQLKILGVQYGIEGLGISREEFIQIHRAFDGNLGQWYKCSKGHLYNIGECGQTMQRGQCPECKKVIGGQDHTLPTGSFIDQCYRRS